MNKFNLAFKILELAEGGYADNPLDEGKETYKGISRRWYPTWEGWDIIDSIKTYMGYDGSKKSKKELNEQLVLNYELQEMVKNFYKKNYWNKFNGDKLPFKIGAKLLEQSVLLGTGRKGALHLQKAINLEKERLNDYPLIKEDGIIGRGTLKELNKLNEDFILKWLTLLQEQELLEEILNKPQKIVFYQAWKNRINKSLKKIAEIKENNYSV